jgi:polyisoprenoid-binding protein YceI
MKFTLIAAALAVAATTAGAAPERYTLDASHSQVVFSYNHLGFSTTYAMFSGFEGEIMFDQEDPSNSQVLVSMPVKSMLTGWEARFEHLMSDDFFGAQNGDLVSFASTSIELTGDKTAMITGDLTVNGVTKSVVLDAVVNQVGDHPMAKKPWAGFSATTKVNRSDFDLGMFAPYVSDELEVSISVEAMKAE